jgi:hypothetical protein
MLLLLFLLVSSSFAFLVPYSRFGSRCVTVSPLSLRAHRVHSSKELQEKLQTGSRIGDLDVQGDLHLIPSNQHHPVTELLHARKENKAKGKPKDKFKLAVSRVLSFSFCCLNEFVVAIRLLLKVEG